jgi:hypothetical protein
VKEVFAGIGVFLLIIIAIVILNAVGFVQWAFFAPKVAQVQTNVFHNSQQYNEGMVRDLENIEDEYRHSTPEEKRALRALAIHRFEVYPLDQMPPDLQNFYRGLQNEVN